MHRHGHNSFLPAASAESHTVIFRCLPAKNLPEYKWKARSPTDKPHGSGNGTHRHSPGATRRSHREYTAGPSGYFVSSVQILPQKEPYIQRSRTTVVHKEHKYREFVLHPTALPYGWLPVFSFVHTLLSVGKGTFLPDRPLTFSMSYFSYVSAACKACHRSSPVSTFARSMAAITFLHK